MKVSKSKAVVRLFITSLIALVSLTGCLEDPKGKPAHAMGTILGANMDNILLDFPTATLGGDGPYCLYFLPNKKIDSVDINSVVQSFPYSVTLKEAKTVEEGENSLNTSCGIGSLKSDGHRSKVKLNTFKLLPDPRPTAKGVPITKWTIKRIVLGGISVTAHITQLEYTPSTAVLQINDKLITQTLVIIGIL